MMPGLTKSRRNGPPIELMFIDDPKLCPVLVLKSYEERTQMYRRSSHSRKQLFNCYHWTQAEEPDEVWLERSFQTFED